MNILCKTIPNFYQERKNIDLNSSAFVPWEEIKNQSHLEHTQKKRWDSKQFVNTLNCKKNSFKLKLYRSRTSKKYISTHETILQISYLCMYVTCERHSNASQVSLFPVIEVYSLKVVAPSRNSIWYFNHLPPLFCQCHFVFFIIYSSFTDYTNHLKKIFRKICFVRKLFLFCFRQLN